MKNKISVLSAVLSAAITVGTAVPLTALAAPPDVVKTELTAYIFSMDKTQKMNCVFSSKLPDVPYITAEDYLNIITNGKFAGNKNADGTYTVSNPNGKMIVNTENDTIYYDDILNYFNGIKPVKDGTMLEAPYFKPIDEIKEDIISLTIDFGAYNIDLIEADGKAYFPLTTVSDLYYDSYNAGKYYNGSIYFVHSTNEMSGDKYFDNSDIYNKLERTPEMIEYSYNELCFIVDKQYGRPSKSAVSASIEQKGFDKTLDEYSDDSRRAKELLNSDKMTDYLSALSYLSVLFSDGGHTMFDLSVYMLPSNTPLTNAIIQKYQNPNDRDAAMFYTSYKIIQSGVTEINALMSVRTKEYSKYQTIKSWGGETNASFLCSGSTGVFVFDSFVDDAVEQFKWALDYAKNNSIKNIIVDVSCNSGGSQAALGYIFGLMTNKDKHTNIVSTSGLDTLTGEIGTGKAYFDFNLDGKFDDLDKDVTYDFNFAVLTSHNSFSCGNLLPIFANDNGIAVFGETSGGGACAVGMFYTPDLFPFTMSGSSKYIDNNGVDADKGARIDVELTAKTTDSFGNETVDYTGLYDIDRLGELTDKFYASANDPNNSQVQPSQTENSQAQSEVSQTQQSPEQASQNFVSGADGDNGSTGNNIIVWVIAAVLPIAALVLCIVLNIAAKKKNLL